MIRATLALSCALLNAAAPATSPDPLMRRAGEWIVTVDEGPFGRSTRKICYATDRSAGEFGALRGLMAKDCSPPTIAAGSGGVTVNMVCVGPTKAKLTVRAVVTPRGADAFHAETRLHLDGMPRGTPDITTTTDAQRAGRCKRDDKRAE